MSKLKYPVTLDWEVVESDALSRIRLNRGRGLGGESLDGFTNVNYVLNARAHSSRMYRI